MKGDFSRDTFRPARRYTSVRLQQGRVHLDSDWNEQAAIREHAERARFEEVVGRSGVPDEGGLAVRVSEDGTLELTAGRAYAGGLLCVLDEPTPLAERGDPPAPARGRTDLVYLDAWERHLTALDDPCLRETALGGPDTTTRLRVAWKPVVVEDVGDLTCAELDGLVSSRNTGAMRAAAPGGYVGLENKLYRVEIHDGGDLGAASFKWSRENGSIVFGVAAFLGSEMLRLASDGEARPKLHVGDWVEISGEASELAGRAGTLARVTSTGDEGRKLTLDRSVARHRDELRPRARLWDQLDAGTPATSPDWIELESGIEVRFSAGELRSGDYWTIAARPATRTIEWPEEDQRPHGPEHESCPLALVTWERSGPAVQDCRRVFSPLKRPARGAHAPRERGRGAPTKAGRLGPDAARDVADEAQLRLLLLERHRARDLT